MARSKNKTPTRRFFGGIGIDVPTADKILSGLKWPDQEQTAGWKITPNDQLHATISTHSIGSSHDLEDLKYNFLDVSKRHPPIHNARLVLRNNFSNSAQFRDNGFPYISIFHFDEETHFHLSEYMMDLHRSLDYKFRGNRPDRYLHVTLARMPFEEPQAVLDFIKANRGYETDPIDITPQLFESILDHNNEKLGGFTSEASFPFLG